MKLNLTELRTLTNIKDQVEMVQKCVEGRGDK